MNRQYIEDNHIIDRYLLGQLSEKEQCEFETYYFEHPQVLEELTIAQAMHTTVHEESARLQSDETVKTKINWFEWLFQPKIGFALSAFLAVGVVSLWFENSQLKSIESVVFPASSVILSQSRGAGGEIDVVQIAQDQSAIAIQVVTGPIGYPEVGLQLSDSRGNLLWQGKSKVEGPLGAVNLVIMAKQLTPREYTLIIFPPNGTTKALSIHKFKVEKF